MEISIILVTGVSLGAGVALGYWWGRRSLSAKSSLDNTSEQLQVLEGRMKESFRSAAVEALQFNQQLLLNQTKQAFETSQNLSAHQLQSTVAPLQNALHKIEGELRGLEQTRTVAYTTLGEQLKELSMAQRELRTQAGALVNALREPKTRGSWGEVQLRRAVEFAGMLSYVDFNEQVNAATDEGNKRPDMVIRLPNKRVVVVDAKVPLEAYTRAIHVENIDEKRKLLGEHARQLRDHFKKLGGKRYFTEYESPEFVVLFLNLESSLSAALEVEPQLIEDAIKERVLIATPTTLIALLKTVAYGWGEAKATDQAREVVALGRELLERFVVVARHWENVGGSLGKAVEAYNQAATSTQNRLMVTARKMDEAKPLPEMAPIVTRPQAVELKKP